MVSEKNVLDTLNKAMEYFLEIEEYEQCGKIRDLLILISNRNKV
jgi:protein-arginine kinase activator protein McsA